LSSIFENVDVAICAAAVADYKPKFVAEQKIKMMKLLQSN
jgi:phosphopantothenoylcysteine synthetase/decarboxylase